MPGDQAMTVQQGGAGAFDKLLDATLTYYTTRAQVKAAAFEAGSAAQNQQLHTPEYPEQVNARPLSAAELLGLSGDAYQPHPWLIPGLIAAGVLALVLIVRR